MFSIHGHSKLEEHLKTHNKDYYSCEKCGKNYQREHFYRQHLVTCAEFTPSFITSGSDQEDADVSEQEERIIDADVPKPEVQNENGDEVVDFDTTNPVDDINHECIVVVDKDEVNSRKLYNREKKVISRKSFDINSMLGNLVQDTKYKILSKALDTTINEAKEELAYTDVEESFEGKVCHAFIDYLIQKKNDSRSFYELISRRFGDDINNEDFSHWLSRKLGIQHHLCVEVIKEDIKFFPRDSWP